MMKSITKHFSIWDAPLFNSKGDHPQEWSYYEPLLMVWKIITRQNSYGMMVNTCKASG